MRVGVAVEWRRAGSTWRVEIMADGAKVRVKAHRAALFKLLNQGRLEYRLQAQIFATKG